MRIFAIESSCDESAVAWFDPAAGLFGEELWSQVDLHAEYGGVVPDLAAREHVEQLPKLIARAVAAHPAAPAAVAVTVGPGLAACLATGMAAGQALALRWGVPLRAVNHLRAHAWSPFIPVHAAAPGAFVGALPALLPHLGLLVSGGNTLLFELDPARRLRVLGQTIDDAAGEALDKGAKLLGLGYPGGPLVEQLAAGGNPRAHDFPRAFADTRELKFSFSGLKTSLRYRLEKLSDAALAAALPDLCASYQQAVVEALTLKLRQALAQGRERGRPYASVGLSGGVANNRRLRAAVQAAVAAAHERAADAAAAPPPVLLAEPRHTGDNAGMVAFAAWLDPHAAHAPFTLAPGLTLGD